MGLFCVRCNVHLSFLSFSKFYSLLFVPMVAVPTGYNSNIQYGLTIAIITFAIWPD